MILNCTYAQLPAEKRVTLNEVNVPLRAIFAKITAQTQISFAGSPNSLDKSYVINAQNETVSSVLEKLLGPKDVNWVFSNNIVLVRDERNEIPIVTYVKTNDVYDLSTELSSVNTNQTSGCGRSTIKCSNSININKGLLYVIDGVPLQTSASAYKNLWSNLTSSEIKEIAFLQDPDALAIYGSRASEGAILITTKHPKKRLLTHK